MPNDKNELIIQPQKKGFSESIEVGGRKGRFNFDVPPQFFEGVGSGKSPLHLFETEEGERFFFRLESNKQGGRWEEGKHFDMELEQIRRNPVIANEFWGQGTPISNFLINATQKGLNNDVIRESLKSFNTHRQISGD